jgi:hypothetical protein
MNQNQQTFYQQKAKIPETSRGPLARQVSFLEERFATLGSKEAGDDKGLPEFNLPLLRPDRQSTNPHQKPDVTIKVRSEPTDVPSATLPNSARREVLEQQRQRQKIQLVQTFQAQLETPRVAPPVTTLDQSNYVASRTIRPTTANLPPAVALVNQTWIPLGPAAVLKGQGGTHPTTGLRPTMSGRAEGIAIAPGGKRIYVAAANGGVWRSEDTGKTWCSLMENFDLNPTVTGTDTLACGAITLVAGAATNADRLYVGTGGTTLNGVGAVVSLDGGIHWQVEPSDPELAGERFYALAVNPGNPNHVVAATSRGLYQRIPNGQGGFHWQASLEYLAGYGCYAKKVVAGRVNNVTTFYAFLMFYAGDWRSAIYSSTDGSTWKVLNNGFPTDATNGNGTLALLPDNSNWVYALLGKKDQDLPELYRLDVKKSTWQKINLAFPNSAKFKWYLQMAVDPNNINRLYLAGNTVFVEDDGYCGEVYRCEVTDKAGNLTATATYIGLSTHADAHSIAFAPGDSNKLWVTTDGGVFYTTHPNDNGYIFDACNTGLATFTMNHLGQHPTEDAILYCGTQDNGGLCYLGDEAWTYVSGGDSGYFVVNWYNPYQVLDTYTYATIRLSNNGSQYESFGIYYTIPLAEGEACLFYAPLVGTPYHPTLLKTNPSAAEPEANLVAFGSERPWISNDFGETWQSIPTNTLNGDKLNGRIKSLTFASATKLYAGTMKGGIYRFDKQDDHWQQTRLDNQPGIPANFALPVTDIAIDLQDDTGNSIYITFGGSGDYRHVWHFKGSQWESRSGRPSDGNQANLLDIQHNAIVVDPLSPNHLYVGADIGVWYSADSGNTWQPCSKGLPDAAVMDLRIHSTHHLLRAATFGRGVFELPLDDSTSPNVILYLRSTLLDRGLYPTQDNLPDPTQPGEVVNHRNSPDLKLSLPDNNGNFPLPTAINFEQFNNQLPDPLPEDTTIDQPQVRVYVKVHNRGPKPANGVGVMLLGTPVTDDKLSPLPQGFAGDVQDNDQITSPEWKTFGTQTVNEVRAGFPKIVCFTIDSKLIARENHQPYGLLALAYGPEDPFNATETNVHQLCFSERKAALKYVKLQPKNKPTAKTAPVKEQGINLLLLDGNTHIDLGNRAALQITGNHTIELWLKPTNFDRRQNPLAKAYGGEYTLTLEKDGSLTYYYGTRGDNGNPYQGFSSNQKLVLNTWTHLAIVRNLDTKKLSWYINGKQTNEGDAIYPTAKASSLTTLLGKGYLSNFVGTLAEVRFWKKVRTPEELQANLNRLLTGKEVGLVAYYRLNEGNGKTVTDLVGGGPATIYGNSQWTLSNLPIKR